MMRADLTESHARLLRARAGDVLRLSMIDGRALYGSEHYVVVDRPCEFVSDPDRGIEMDVLPLAHGGQVEFVTVTARVQLLAADHGRRSWRARADGSATRLGAEVDRLTLAPEVGRRPWR